MRDHVHGTIEGAQAIGKPCGHLTERRLQRRKTENRRRETGALEAIAQKEEFQPVEPEAMDDNDRSGVRVQPAVVGGIFTRM